MKKIVHLQAMRNFWVILGHYILLLTILPCKDHFHCPDGELVSDNGKPQPILHADMANVNTKLHNYNYTFFENGVLQVSSQIVDREPSFPLQDHPENQEKCTPFCHCTCCGKVLNYLEYVIDIASLGDYNSRQKFANTTDPLHAKNYFKFWQPPKIFC